MPNASLVIDRVSQLADWDQPSFADGEFAQWDADAGKFVGGSVDALPQALAPASSPTFAGLTLTSFSGVLRTSTGLIVGGSTTTHLPEGTNLYYTAARFDAAFAAKSTTNLGEGSNLYFTDVRARAALPAQSSNANKSLSTDGTSLRWASGVGVRPYSFLLALGTPAAPGTNLTNKLTVERDGAIREAFINAKTGPVGAALIVDIKKNGTSIWNATPANRLRIADSASAGSQASFDTIAVTKGDLLSIDIAQVGSTSPGQDVTVQLLVEFTPA